MISAPGSRSSKPEKTAVKLGLPLSVWSMVSTYLTSPIDFNSFIRASKLFLSSGTKPLATRMNEAISPQNHLLCAALYRRLCAIDVSLPQQFVTQDPITEYATALAKVQQAQEQEIVHLSKNHAALVKKYYDVKALIKLTTLARLEAINQILDSINSEIITSVDSFGQGNSLDLSEVGITRMPSSLIANPQYQVYFQSLRELNCNNNFIRALRLANLPALAIFDIEENLLCFLQLHNLPALSDIRLLNNKLAGELDLTAFSSLTDVSVHANQLTRLNVKGLQLLNLLDCSYNELTELFVDSPAIADLNCMMNELQKLEVTHVTHLTSHVDDTDPNVQGLSVYANPEHMQFSPNLLAKFGAELTRQLNYDQGNRSDVEMHSEHEADLENEESITEAPDAEMTQSQSDNDSDDEMESTHSERQYKRRSSPT
ncbi:MAG: hypothetical protein AB7I18_04660 [Candidatus Berkiella sp.]